MYNPSEIALKAENLSLALDGNKVLESFSLEIATGQKILITGPSGCGKSTILKCFLGLVIPETGSIAITGKPLTSTTVWSLRQRIAYVTQEPDLTWGTVRQVIDKPFHFRANTHLRNNLDRLSGLMGKFGLENDLLDKNVSKLSGGEKQRVALIVALLLDRPILLLDEPTSALDVRTKRILGEYLHSRTDLTALVVSHDTDSFEFADNIVQLQNRREGETA